MTRQVTLMVNDGPVQLDYFAQSFIDHTVAGMVEALEGTGPVKNVVLSIDKDKVSMVLNGSPVPTNPFASKIIRNTISGTVSSLKGVDQIRTLQVNISR